MLARKSKTEKKRSQNNKRADAIEEEKIRGEKDSSHWAFATVKAVNKCTRPHARSKKVLDKMRLLKFGN